MTTRDPTGSLIYTHGTGTRTERFERDWDLFRLEARRRGFANVRMMPCAWGPKRRDGVPDRRLINRLVPGGERSDSTLEWELLERDPFFELRLAGTFLRGRDSASASNAGISAALLVTPATALGDLASKNEVVSACRAVAESAELAEAERSAPAEWHPALCRAAARASVALAMARMQGQDASVAANYLDLQSSADEAVSRLSQALGAESGEPAPWTETFVRFARASEWPSRSCLTTAAAEFFADVFWYVRSSELIASDLAEAIRAAQDSRPVVVVAHSLGGIAAVDLLTDPSRSEDLAVDMLVTFGTQAGLLYAMDAMRFARLDDGEPSEARVPRWLSFHGVGDLLSFKIAPLVGLSNDPIDLPVGFSKRFPAAHGEYIELDVFWDTIRAKWPG